MYRIIKCSRWNELVEAMKFHINFAKAAVAPTEFRYSILMCDDMFF